MIISQLKQCASAMALVAIVAGQHVCAQEPLPAKAYTSLPNMQSVKMSPNAQQIGYITHSEGRKVLILENTDGGERIMVPPVDAADILTFYWATDDRVLVAYELAGSFAGSANQTHTATRLIAVNRDGTSPDWIVRNHEYTRVGSRVGKEEYPPSQYQHHIVDLLRDDPEHVLLSLDADHDGAYEVRKMNIYDGSYSIYRDDQRGIQFWWADHTGDVRFGAGYVAGKSDHVSTLKGPDDKWISLRNAEWAKTYEVEGFTEASDIIFVSGPSQYGTNGLYKLDLNSGQVVETIFEHKQVDVGGVLDHPETGKPAGYYYTVDTPTVVYFDATLKKVQGAIDKALPNTRNLIIGKAKGAHTYLIDASSPSDPGVYYWLDFKSKAMNVLGSYMPDVTPASSSPITSVSVPMRDGTYIPTYLTRPKGQENATGLPTVVLVHGGPQARDTASWDWWSQFLASRGYAVLQPNFRGSTGYGKAFEEAGELQWGGLMQDDVTDATKWAIESGIADGKNICIVGASYGGYAALMGVIKEQGLYTCAASINGVTDLPRLKASDKYGVIGGRAWIKTMGLKGRSDSDVSPYHRAKEISAPVLLMSSKDDTRIDYDMSEDLNKKLVGLSKESTYVLMEDGGHQMDTAASRLTVLTTLEKFLAKHIGN
ncbi:alpha/beta hydrolase family protein [Kordiimonas sp.]|uniref:alpha/beta hydrolase family protein n=1 Tax=Kordiimonas sp. TaxID=1970157 RepID=UPI003A953A6D